MTRRTPHRQPLNILVPFAAAASKEDAVVHEEYRAWFAEARRLLVEAEERLDRGGILPALSSLAAVPPLHRMIVERCSEMLDNHPEPTHPPHTPPGLYL
jgi:hypothetical protein